ncbi:hypothetical protein [Pseudofrankia inefficax]|uniref:hypothetical protein n=1 Tax=Pseudofrankia inefficax (strain DSM 45817 / CECT 9037 / DDB 130130 / EuI1c) TaxID=298654 RepID=UPI0012FD31F5|nr:hypothetical protein [Pseudofrankia inefficax]
MTVVLITLVGVLTLAPDSQAAVRRKVAPGRDHTLRASNHRDVRGPGESDDYRNLVVGNALAGTILDAGPVKHGYRAVWVNGVDRCLWMPVDGQTLQTVSGKARHSCDTFEGLNVGTFASRVNCLTGRKPACSPTNNGSPARIRTSRPGCAAVPAYGNVFPWRTGAQPRDQYGTIRHDYNVLWRYVTKDKRFVMVNDNHKRRDPTFAQTRPAGGHWFFVPAACIDLH